MLKHKIGWCSVTWNPVVGCKGNCNYCYAKRINDRFKFIENWNEPEWREKSFNKIFPKKPQRIFVDSMSEIYYWEEEWMNLVLKKIKNYPQHIFMFLTQHPEVYAQHLFPSNCWYGVTLTNNKPIQRSSCIPTKKGLRFLSIEPILEYIDIRYIDYLDIDWIIVGAETGNRKGKIVPKRVWIESIVNYCKLINIPVYLKDSLKEIYPEEIKEFPEWIVI